MPPKKKGPFFFLMREVQTELKQRNLPCSMEDAKQEAGVRWQNMSTSERAVYENMAKDFKERGKGSLYNKFTSDGRPIALVLKEEEEKIKQREDMIESIHQFVDDLGSMNEVKRSPFFIISFNILCEVNGSYPPLEIGLIEYTIENGFTRAFHRFINPGPIPLGFASAAKDHSEDTHGIPITGFTEGESNYVYLVKEMLDFLQPEDNPVPFFCTEAHLAQAEGCLRWLEEHSCCTLDFPVWDILPLLRKLRHVAGEEISSAEAETILNCAVFDYESRSLCSYHAELDNKNCALGESRRLGYKMSNALLSAYNVKEVIDYQHLPPRFDPSFSFEVSRMNVRPARIGRRPFTSPSTNYDQVSKVPTTSPLQREARTVQDYYQEHTGPLVVASQNASTYKKGKYWCMRVASYVGSFTGTSAACLHKVVISF